MGSGDVGRTRTAATSVRHMCPVCDPPSITRSNTLTHNCLCVRWLTFFDFSEGENSLGEERWQESEKKMWRVIDSGEVGRRRRGGSVRASRVLRV